MIKLKLNSGNGHGRKFLLLLLLFLLTPLFIFAQKSVSGVVTSEADGEPLIGANVLVKGTDIGTITDIDGRYTLDNIPEDAVIVISYIGYDAQEIGTEGRNDIDVIVTATGELLQELIVTGYTTERKKDLTGAVAVADVESIRDIASGNPMISLQGRIPGLFIEADGSSDVRPKRIWIRGANTLGNNNPLYIIDGVPTTRPFAFSSLNPSSIESIQVLKDAASASVYGARASNGVIIVTTKQGGGEKLNIQFNSSVKVGSMDRQKGNYMNTEELGRARWLGAVNDGTDPIVLQDIYTYDWNGDFNNPVLNRVNPVSPVGGDPNFPVGDTDWWDVIYKTQTIIRNDLTVSGGTENSRMLLNLAHYKDDGMLRKTGYERVTARLNMSSSFFDVITIGANIMQVASVRKQDPIVGTIGVEGNILAGYGTEFRWAAGGIGLSPTMPLNGLDGSLGAPIGGGYTDAPNVLILSDVVGQWDRYRNNITFGNVYADFKPIDNLVIRTSFGLDYSHLKEKNIDPAWTNGNQSNQVNSLDIFTTDRLSRTWSNTANYTLDFGENRLGFLAGVEAIWDDFDTYYVGRRDFAANDEEDFYVLSAATGETQSNQFTTGSRLLSIFGKVNYAFADKYLIAATIRRDGSSRFGPENRWGIFPAVSAGWRIINESFMSDAGAFSDLKLRAGWGRVGNQEIGDRARFALYEPRAGYLFNDGVGFPGFWTPHGTAYDIAGNDGGVLPSGFVSVQGGNDALRWETTEEINVGLDFGFMDDKLYGTFDYFTRETTDILIQPPVATAVGEGKLKWLNGATKENQGFELLLGFRDQKGDWSYNIQGNIAGFKDKITVLPEEVRTAYPGNAENSIVGHTEFSYFGYRTDGLFQSQAEVEAHATQIGAGPGRIRYVDLNNDGVIDPSDQEFFATYLPDFTYGLQIDLGYKNWDLQIFGMGSQGRLGPNRWISCNTGTISIGSNFCSMILDGWTPQNPNSEIPRPTIQSANVENRLSDFTVRNTSFFKLRQAILSYTIPAIPAARIGQLRIFVIGDNLFWFKAKEFLGPDPEQAILDARQAGVRTFDVTGSNSALGRPTAITVGVNLTFN